MNDHLAQRLTIGKAVAAYLDATAAIRKACTEMAEAEDRLNAVFTLDGIGQIRLIGHHRSLDIHDPKDALLEIRHDVWRALVERLEIRRLMSSKRWDELSRCLDRKDSDRKGMPEITERSVTELVESFHSNLHAMLEEAVEEVFNFLRPRRSEYKTNSEYEVPRKVVLSHIVEKWDHRLCSSWRVNYHREQDLTALENVFTALDGKGQITKTYWSAISTAIRTDGFTGIGETPYFKFKCFRNGNMHLEFRRIDLLDKFNRLAGGRRLRAAAAE